MNIVGVVALLLLLVVPLAICLVALIDLLQRDSAEWDAAGQNQIVWVLLILLAPFLGGVLYLTIAKKKLNAVAAPN